VFLFSWEKVFDEAEGSPLECCRIMEMLINKQIPTNRYDPIYKYSEKSFNGTSFLLHPDVMSLNAYKYSHRDVAIYYALAAIRSMADYLATKQTTLDVYHVPVDLEIIENNSLLRLEGDMVHFLYEEVTMENTH
jgi:hypothetical protein